MSGIIEKSCLLMGKCVPCLKKDASKFLVKTLELDTNLLMYFRKTEYIYAHDPGKICKDGDVVLVRKLPERMSNLITHKVLKVVYPLGDITDPITGKKVVVSEYRDTLEERVKKYGPLASRFQYDKAPPRGWQEDKKDFSHRTSYTKYTDFEHEDQPYAV